MATTTEYPRRTGRIRRAGALVKVPRVVVAAVLWLVLIEAIPVLAAWVVLAVVLAGTVAAVAPEPGIVRLQWWERRPSTPIAVPGDPAGPSRPHAWPGGGNKRGRPDAAIASSRRLGR